MKLSRSGVQCTRVPLTTTLNVTYRRPTAPNIASAVLSPISPPVNNDEKPSDFFKGANFTGLVGGNGGQKGFSPQLSQARVDRGQRRVRPFVGQRSTSKTTVGQHEGLQEARSAEDHRYRRQ